MKKIFTLLLAVMAGLSTVSAATNVKIDGWYYNLDETHQTAEVGINYYSSFSGEWVIPAYVVYNNVTYAVTSIGDAAFYYCSGLTSVTIPNSVTSIGFYAFAGCSNLFSLTVPSSVTSISYYAFEGVPNVIYSGTATGSPWGAKCINGYLDGYILYTGATKVTVAACLPSATGNIVLPNSVTTINASAFSGCKGITGITLPSSVTTIGSYAFSGCTGLPVVDSVRYADWYLIGATDKTRTSYSIQSNTKWIAEEAFSNCTNVVTLNVPASVTKIGSNAFNNIPNVNYTGTATGSPWGARCINGYIDGLFIYTDATKTTLVSCDPSASGTVVVPNSVTTIQSYAFRNCKEITNISLPSSITTIGSNAFYGCTGLPVEDGIRYADWYIVEVVNKNQTAYTIKQGTKWIPESLFSNNFNVTSITIPNSVTNIGSEAFYNCTKIFSITIPNSVTTIGTNAFYGIKNVVYSGTATGSPWGAKCVNGYAEGYLLYTDATKTTLVACERSATGTIAIPNSVTTIKEEAFRNCTGITDVSLPGSITTIGDNAFYGCTGLPVVDSVRYADWYLVEATDQTMTSYSIKSGTKWIANRAFDGCSKVTTFSIPNSVTSIGNRAFEDCSSLTSITIPSSVTSIGSYAFEDCTNLESATINSSKISSYMFYGCSKLSAVTIGTNVTSIESYAFQGCSSLFSITVPATVTTIGYYAFNDLYNVVYTGTATGSPWGAKCINGYLDGYILYTAATRDTVVACLPSATGEIVLPNSVTTINASAFNGRKGITGITLPSSVTTIGSYAFSGCTGLPVVDSVRYADWYLIGATNKTKASYSIQSNTKWIAEEAFSNCTNVITLNVPASVTKIGSNAFNNIPNVNYTGTATGSPWGARCINGYVDGLFIYTDATKTTLVSCDPSASGTVVIPNSVTTIQSYAFRNCKEITDISLPGSITTIGSGAFSGCTGLPVVDGIRYADWYIVEVVNKNQTSYTIKQGTKWIPESIFRYNSYVTSITIPNSVTTIGSNAFYYCTNLTSITIPNSVTSIGSEAFYNCTKIFSITIPNSVTSIGRAAFFNCTKLLNLTIPATVATIGEFAFSGILNVNYTGTATGSPWGAKCINGYVEGDLVYSDNTQTVIVDCNADVVGTITIPRTVTTIKDKIFRYCYNLTEIDVDAANTMYCSVNGVLFNKDTTTVILYPRGNTATSYTMPNSVETINEHAFDNCALVSVTLGENLSRVGPYAFYSSKLRTVTSRAIVPPALSTKHGYHNDYYGYYDYPQSFPEGCTLYVPINSLADYQGSAWARVFSPIIGCCIVTFMDNDNNVLDVRSAEYGKAVSTPPAPEIIGYSFAKWSADLTNIITDMNVTPIYTRDTIDGLYYIYDTGNNTAILDHEGENYVQRTSIVVPATFQYKDILWTVNAIKDSAFYGCYYLQQVTIPSNVLTIGQSVFKGCYSLQSITFEGNVPYGLNSYTFGDCVNLTTIYVPCGKADVYRNAIGWGYNIVEISPYEYDIRSADETKGTVMIDEYNCAQNSMVITAVAQEKYHFVQWSDGNTSNPRTIYFTTDTTLMAYFEYDEPQVTYVGLDGEILGVETVLYNGTATAAGINPNDAFGYTFTGWDKDLTHVTSDMTVTALYKRDAVNGFYYIYNKENRTAVLDREGDSYANMKTLNVPNHFIYRGIDFSVVAIGASAFEGCDRLTDVVLPSNVEYVYIYAFSGCSDMVRLTMSAGLRGIEDYAFKGCKRLEEITVYAERVPDLTATSFDAVGNKKYINVYVPDNRVNSYKRDEYWSEFNIVEKTAETVAGKVDDVTVEPEETTAQFTWPTESNAGSYTIQITKDGEVFCTLIFNANGQLTGIAFAPGRDANKTPAATLANGGMQFTVTGLDAGTHYAYTVTTKDTQENVIATYAGSFNTGGSFEGVDLIQSGSAPHKILRNGQILILRGEKAYTLQGQEVR